MLLPESSNDILELRGTRRVRGRRDDRARQPPEAIERANDKGAFFELFDEIGVRAPSLAPVRGGREVEAAARELGYPAVCFKPRSRRVAGVPSSTRRRPAMKLLHGRPGSVANATRGGLEILPAEGGEELLVMELAEGAGDRSRRLRRAAARCCSPTPKVKDASGQPGHVLRDPRLPVPRRGGREDRRRPRPRSLLQRQRRGRWVIEINPRISTWVYQEDLNMPWLGAGTRSASSPTRISRSTARASGRPAGRLRSSTRSSGTSVRGVEPGQHREHAAVVVLARREAQLPEDAGHVLLDRAVGDHEPARDGRVRPALGHELEHLALARRQLVDRTVADEELADDLGIERRPADRRRGERVHELGAVGDPVLEQVAEPFAPLARSSRA